MKNVSLFLIISLCLSVVDSTYFAVPTTSEAQLQLQKRMSLRRWAEEEIKKIIHSANTGGVEAYSGNLRHYFPITLGMKGKLYEFNVEDWFDGRLFTRASRRAFKFQVDVLYAIPAENEIVKYDQSSQSMARLFLDALRQKQPYILFACETKNCL